MLQWQPFAEKIETACGLSKHVLLVLFLRCSRDYAEVRSFNPPGRVRKWLVWSWHALKRPADGSSRYVHNA